MYLPRKLISVVGHGLFITEKPDVEGELDQELDQLNMAKKQP